MKNWKVNSWRKYPVKHIPDYPDKKDLDKVLDKIKTFPPLVFAGETRHLKQQLAEVVDGKDFYYKVVIVQKVLLSFIQTTSETHSN